MLKESPEPKHQEAVEDAHQHRRDLFRDDVLASITAGVDKHGDLARAVRDSLDNILRRESFREFFESFGELALTYAWRRTVARPSRVAVISRRHHDPALLRHPRSVFDALIKVDDRWMRLGDMHVEDIEVAYNAYKRLEQENGARAARLLKLKRAMGKSTEAVRDTLDEAKVEKIFVGGLS